MLTGGGTATVKRPREEFVVHFPHYDKDAIGPASAILLGDFKLIRVYETGGLKLFNIAKDPGERDDLAQEMPDKAKELNQRLSDYLTAVNAQMPTANPNYDPSKPSETMVKGKGRGRGQGKAGREEPMKIHIVSHQQCCLVFARAWPWPRRRTSRAATRAAASNPRRTRSATTCRRIRSTWFSAGPRGIPSR